MWSDFKNKTLKAYYTAAKGDFVKAISNRPLGVINEETWLALCDHFRIITTPDPVSGNSKSTVCSTSRKQNKMNHGSGRTSIASWSSNCTAKYEVEPTVAHVFDRGYLRIDAVKVGEGSTSQNPTGLCDNPKLRVLSAKLHQGVQDRMKVGIESSIASSATVMEIFGKPKLGVLQHRQRKGQSSTKQTNASLEQQLAESQAKIQTIESRMKLLEAYMHKKGKMPMTSMSKSEDEDEDEEEDEEDQEDEDDEDMQLM